MLQQENLLNIVAKQGESTNKQGLLQRVKNLAEQELSVPGIRVFRVDSW